jgi:8-oxo-dGTP diphosphatase
VDATARRLIGVYYEASTDTHDFVFVCVPDNPDFSPSPQAPETTDCGFFAHDHLPEPMSEFTRRRVRDAVVGAVPALPVTI